MVLLVAGRQASGSPLEFAVKLLREQGVEMYVVAIGDRPLENELRIIASDEKYAIRIPSFNDLPRTALTIAKTLGNQPGERISN